MIKVERSFPAPASLDIEKEKKNGSYTESDVITQLKSDFHNKCYICGLKGLQDPQVEHLRPHKDGQYKDLKFDWENLFLSCGHCNSVKNQEKYENNIIDCCKEDPEAFIDFQLKENNVLVMAKEEDNIVAMRTAELITEVFTKKKTGLQTFKSEHRVRAHQLEMNVFYDSLEEYRENKGDK